MTVFLKRSIALLLIFFCINLSLPQISFSQDHGVQTNTISSVESVSTPEADIAESGSNLKWWMIALGVVAIAAVAAMAGGGGGGGGSNSNPSPSTGNIAVTW